VLHCELSGKREYCNTVRVLVGFRTGARRRQVTEPRSASWFVSFSNRISRMEDVEIASLEPSASPSFDANKGVFKIHRLSESTNNGANRILSLLIARFGCESWAITRLPYSRNSKCSTNFSLLIILGLSRCTGTTYSTSPAKASNQQTSLSTRYRK
jgi:hypothetical protein